MVAALLPARSNGQASLQCFLLSFYLPVEVSLTRLYSYGYQMMISFIHLWAIICKYILSLTFSHCDYQHCIVVENVSPGILSSLQTSFVNLGETT